MKCPACTQPMNHRDRGGTEIDVCPNCRGVWLDATELDAILGVDDGASVEAGLDESAALPTRCRYCGEETDRSGQCQSCDRPAGLCCPRDDRSMYIVDAAGIELDRCPGCKGLWVDGFERAKLGKMRDELVERAGEMRGDSTGHTAAALIGMGTVGQTSSGEGLDSVFAFGAESGVQNDESDDNRDEQADGDDGDDQSAGPAIKENGQVRNVREYFDKYGGFEVECVECSKPLSRYTAWETEGVVYCVPCAEEKLPDSVTRAMKYQEPRSFSDSLEDEQHLLEVLSWLVSGIFRWRR